MFVFKFKKQLLLLFLANFGDSSQVKNGELKIIKMGIIKKRIKAIRKELNLSQTQMAKMLEIPLRTYQRLEQEDVDLKLSILNKYIRIGVNIDWLLTGEGSMFSKKEADSNSKKDDAVDERKRDEKQVSSLAENSEKMGKRLKEIRLHYELSQTELANRLNTTQAVISNYEAGRRIPDANFLRKLIDVFQIDINWLLTGEGSMFKDKCGKEDIDQAKDRIKRWIDSFWEKASEKERYWFEVQFEKCFPEFREWKEKRK